MDKDNFFYKYNYMNVRSLHKELTNVLLLCMEESNSFYCYCDNVKRTTCSLRELCQFLRDENKKIENLSCKTFLQLNYSKREKLDLFINLISPFFTRIKVEKEAALDFFNKEYYWHSRDIKTGEVHFVSLDQIIENDKDLVKNNPELFLI